MKKEEKQKKENKLHNIMKKKHIIIIAITIIAIVSYSVYSGWKLISDPTDVFMVEDGTVSLEEIAEGYVIRNEKVVKGENYKNGIVPIKAEGEKAAKDESIFRYYSEGEDELVEKIRELDQKIDEAKSKENTTLFSSDIKAIEKEIDIKLEQIYQSNDIKKIEEYKKEIADLMNKKTNIIGKASPANSYLTKLIEERSGYETQLNSGSEDVKSPMSGIVSYKVDGLEEVLTPDKFSSYNQEFFDGLNLKTGQMIASNDECGKVVDNSVCYIATIIEKEKTHEAEQGDKLTIRLSNADEIPAEIYYMQEQEDKVLLILKVEKDVKELIHYRKISFDIIFWSYTGLKVPNTAILEENNLSYVVRNRAGYLDKILVKIKRKNDTYSIIGNYDMEELKELGFSSSQIRSNKNITLYDEILTKPDPTKIE